MSSSVMDGGISLFCDLTKSVLWSTGPSQVAGLFGCPIFYYKYNNALNKYKEFCNLHPVEARYLETQDLLEQKSTTNCNVFEEIEQITKSNQPKNMSSIALNEMKTLRSIVHKFKDKSDGYKWSAVPFIGTIIAREKGFLYKQDPFPYSSIKTLFQHYQVPQTSKESERNKYSLYIRTQYGDIITYSASQLLKAIWDGLPGKKYSSDFKSHVLFKSFTDVFGNDCEIGFHIKFGGMYWKNFKRNKQAHFFSNTQTIVDMMYKLVYQNVMTLDPNTNNFIMNTLDSAFPSIEYIEYYLNSLNNDDLAPPSEVKEN
jgi:hypothetical protein